MYKAYLRHPIEVIRRTREGRLLCRIYDREVSIPETMLFNKAGMDYLDERRASLDECKWTEDEEGWKTDCNGVFIITDGTPMLNDMLFCCYCGKPLEQVDWEWWND